VADVSSSHRVVGGAGAGRSAERSECPLVHGVAETVVADVAGQHRFLRFGSPGDRRRAGVVLAGFGVGVALRVIAKLGQYPRAPRMTPSPGWLVYRSASGCRPKCSASTGHRGRRYRLDEWRAAGQGASTRGRGRYQTEACQRPGPVSSAGNSLIDIGRAACLTRPVPDRRTASAPAACRRRCVRPAACVRTPGIRRPCSVVHTAPPSPANARRYLRRS
jgi:hypothetical protein